MTKPIIKWLGGKTQLLPQLQKKMPEHYGTYFEPFAGGAALFFATSTEDAVLNDSNAGLVNMYVSVRDKKDELTYQLDQYESEFNGLPSVDAKQDFYYQTRSDYNYHVSECNLTVDDAARFIFLNKTCYNGLYRENKAGQFNAAFNHTETIKLYDAENLDACSSSLQNVALMNGDFEDACQNVTAGDFVYLDPPYDSTFTGYQKGGFSMQDQIRVFNLFKRLSDEGVYCMVSNSDTSFITDLYSGFNIEAVDAKRIINRDGSNRTGKTGVMDKF